jgi:hypothetical protein
MATGHGQMVGSWHVRGKRPGYNKSRCFETFPFPDQDTGLTPELRNYIANLAEQIDALRKRVLTPPRSPETGQTGAVGSDLAREARMSDPQPPSAPLPAAKNKDRLTLTGLYNVLEALREGRELTPKEKQIHTHGLVGVLKDLHDELDTAVLQAYGWTLDARRHSRATGAPGCPQRTSCSRGKSRYCALAAPGVSELACTTTQAEALSKSRADYAYSTRARGRFSTQHSGRRGPTHQTPKGPVVAIVATPWPATLPEQVRAVAAVLAAGAHCHGR